MGNINIENASQYKYIYKIYFSNIRTNIERFPIIYISKKACYYSDGSGYLICVKSEKLFEKEDSDEIIADIIIHDFYYYSSWKSFYVISKYKIDEEIKKIKIKINKEIVMSQINILQNKLNKIGE